MSWDKEEAVRLWTAGHSAGDIARTLFVTRNQVIGVVNRRGLQRRDASRPARGGSLTFWTPERDEELTRLYLAGCPLSEIATAVGASTNGAVSHRRGILGLSRPEAVNNQNRNTNRARPGQKAMDNPSSTLTGSWGLGRTAEVVAPSFDLVARAEAADTTVLKTLMERGAFDCSFPVGAPDPERGQLFCAAPATRYLGYCPACESKMRGNTVRPLRRLSDGQTRRVARTYEAEADTDLCGMIA